MLLTFVALITILMSLTSMVYAVFSLIFRPYSLYEKIIIIFHILYLSASYIPLLNIGNRMMSNYELITIGYWQYGPLLFLGVFSLALFIKGGLNNQYISLLGWILQFGYIILLIWSGVIPNSAFTPVSGFLWFLIFFFPLFIIYWFYYLILNRFIPKKQKILRIVRLVNTLFSNRAVLAVFAKKYSLDINEGLMSKNTSVRGLVNGYFIIVKEDRLYAQDSTYLRIVIQTKNKARLKSAIIYPKYKFTTVVMDRIPKKHTQAIKHHTIFRSLYLEKIKYPRFKVKNVIIYTDDNNINYYTNIIQKTPAIQEIINKHSYFIDNYIMVSDHIVISDTTIDLWINDALFFLFHTTTLQDLEKYVTSLIELTKKIEVTN